MIQIAMLAIAAMVVIGCTGGPGTMTEVEPTPNPVMPVLLGTWVTEGEFEVGTEEGGPRRGHGTRTLTFTPDRWIEVVSVEAGTTGDELTISDNGGWSQEGDLITKVDRSGLSTTATYRFDGESLLLSQWSDDDIVEPDDVWRYERASPTVDLTGTWQRLTSQGREYLIARLTIRQNGLLEFLSLNSASGEFFRLTATWSHDDQNTFINLENVATSKGDPSSYTRFAYAPANEQGSRIIISVPWIEANQQYPYGWYWTILEPLAIKDGTSGGTLTTKTAN